MKRLVAILFAAVFSIFSGLEIVLPKNDDFYFSSSEESGAFYQVDEDSGGISYKGLYGEVRGFNWTGEAVCDPTQRQDVRDEWVQITSQGKPNWSQSLYSPVTDGTAKIETSAGTKDAIVYTITSDTDVNISAPAAGTIDTSHYACNYGKTMDFVITFSDGNVYTVYIEDAKCWYCCANKPVPEDGRYTATTTDSLKGKSMRAGDVLCVGENGTTVTIVHTTV